jgi:small subunit ribosomal protein S23
VDEAETEREESFARRVCLYIFFSQSCFSKQHFSAVKFAVNLHKYHEITLNDAYAQAVAQFRSLRAEHQVATTTAALEAEAYGATFPMTEIERNFLKEQKELDSWQRKAELDAGAIIARKRWKAIIEREGRVGSGWSRGQDYVRLWKEGVRPSYAPSLTEPTETGPTAKARPDFIALRA